MEVPPNTGNLQPPAQRTYKLREALHKQINQVAGDNKLVTNVYFKEFLIQ